MPMPRKDSRKQNTPIQYDHKYYSDIHHSHPNEHHSIEQKPSDVHCQCEVIKANDLQITSGKIVAKIPVVLAELTLQANIDTIIEFPEYVLEIKDVKKRLKITQCRLLLPSNKLFIKGFVRKNILYASPSEEIAPKTKKVIASDLHSLTVDIPLQCVAEIKNYLSQPLIPETNERSEFEFLDVKPLSNDFPEKDQYMSSDLSQFHQESNQFYNELPYSELVSSKILEWDEAIDRRPLPAPAPLEEGYFTKMEEKMVVEFTIKVLQNQSVRITSLNERC